MSSPWVFEEPWGEHVYTVEGYREQMESEVTKRLNEVVPDEVRNWCQVESVVRSGKAYPEILKTAEETEADLIVMGVVGRNPLDIMLFGSTTQHVVRRAKCPVLTVRSKPGEHAKEASS